MSDDFGSIDACLDGAFAAVDGAHAAIAEEIDHGVLPPNALSTQGIWELAKETKEKEKVAKAEKAERAKDGKDEKSERDGRRAIGNRQLNKAEQQDGLDGAIEKALKKAPEAAQKSKEDRTAEAKGEKAKPLSTKDFGGTREHRRAIKSLFPGEKLSQVLTVAEKWDAALRENPTLETVEKLAAEILKLPRTAKGKETAEAAEGKTKSVDRAFEDAGDREDMQAFVEKYGDRLPGILERLSIWLPDLKEDPHGAGARLLASFGALDTPAAPAQQQAPQASHNGFVPGSRPPQNQEEHAACVLEGINRHAKASMPGLLNDDIAEAVAMVLQVGAVPRTNNPDADLLAAYRMVVPEGTVAPPVKDDKGSKSIKGAPSAASGRGRAKGGANNLDDAISRAFGGV